MYSFRDLFYSPICDTDSAAYQTYLSVAVKYGEYIKFSTEQCWTPGGQQYNGCFDNVKCDVDSPGVGVVFTSQDAPVGVAGSSGGVGGEFDSVGGSVESGQRGRSSVGWLSGGCACNDGSCTRCCVCDVSVQNVGVAEDTTNRDGSLGSKVSSKRGPNFLRNQANRVAQKARKKKRQAMGDDWRKRRSDFSVKCDVESGVSVEAQQGFWGSCSSQVRQELIDSKARMHIAENERREREAREKLAYMDSPYGVMQRCVKMAEFAQNQAAKDKDSKIYGWAQSVANSSAESLAKTLPSSVPSYEELSAKLEASSQSSFELELKAKQDEIDSVKSRMEEETRKAQDLIEEERKKTQDFEKKYLAVQRRIKQMEIDSNPQVRVMSFSKRDFEEEMRPPRFRGVMG